MSGVSAEESARKHVYLITQDGLKLFLGVAFQLLSERGEICHHCQGIVGNTENCKAGLFSNWRNFTLDGFCRTARKGRKGLSGGPRQIVFCQQGFIWVANHKSA